MNRSRWIVVLAVFLCLLLVVAMGCKSKKKTVIVLAPTPQEPPIAVITDPSGGTHLGDVTITYTITDANGDPAGIVAHFSIDSGATWTTCTMAAGGDGITALGTSPSGTSHTYVWDTLTDSVGTSAAQPVQVRITPSDNDGTGTAGTTGFTVDNLPDQPPTVQITAPTSGTQSADITITYSITDVDSDPAGITVEYSTDGGSSWNSCTEGSGGDGTASLTSSPSGVSHTYVWDTVTDGVGTSTPESVTVMITPDDKDGTGTEDTTAFTVDNQTGPPLDVSDPTGDQANGGTAADLTGMQGTYDATNAYIHVDITGTVVDDMSVFYALAIDSNNSGTLDAGDYMATITYFMGAPILVVGDYQGNPVTGTGITCEKNPGGGLDFTIPRSLVDPTAFGVSAITLYYDGVNVLEGDVMPDPPQEATFTF